jgi:undecaprenyl-diphosphatase
MTLLQALVLGIIQGLTEFLPISSTAHLRVIPALVGWEDPGAAFTAVIQGGTLAAVLIYFAPDIRRLFLAWARALARRRPWETADAKLAWLIVAGTVPVVVCGLAFKRQIEGPWRSLYVIAAASIVLALLLRAAEATLQWRQRTGRTLKDLAHIGWLDALVVGGAQAVALVPGSSRSGVTITAGLFAGLDRETAARFSFLLSLPSLLAAGVYELYKERQTLLASQSDALNLLLATVVSGVVGYASIAFLLAFLRTRSTYVFIAYRLILGVVLLLLLQRGLLQP